MMIKKFKGKTQEEAIVEAKKEMGEEAIMLSSRLVSNVGLFKAFKAKLVEVTMALEEKEVRNPAVAHKAIEAEVVTSTTPEKPKPQFSIFTPELIAKTEQEMEIVQPKKAIEDKLDSLQNLLEKQIQLTELKERNEVFYSE
ncbi:MAG: hypothetical protein R3Y54_10845, partial [Eubacteriales bacterium]